MSNYNPAPIRRRVRRTLLVKGQQGFVAKSFTRPAVVHFPVIDLEAGTVFCTCEDFTYRHAASAPTVNDSQHHCKHISRALSTCVRVGQLQEVRTSAAPVLVPAAAQLTPEQILAQPFNPYNATIEQRNARTDAKLALGLITLDGLL